MDNAHKPCPYCEYNTKIGTENINNHIKDNHPDLDTIELDKPDQTDCYICSSKMSKYYLKEAGFSNFSFESVDQAEFIIMTNRTIYNPNEDISKTQTCFQKYKGKNKK